jgi:hypothetical protein
MGFFFYTFVWDCSIITVSLKQGKIFFFYITFRSYLAFLIVAIFAFFQLSLSVSYPANKNNDRLLYQDKNNRNSVHTHTDARTQQHIYHQSLRRRCCHRKPRLKRKILTQQIWHNKFCNIEHATQQAYVYVGSQMRRMRSLRPVVAPCANKACTNLKMQLWLPPRGTSSSAICANIQRETTDKWGW